MIKIELKRQYEILLRKANTDISVAELLIESENENIDQEVILFHLQQASEKLIKAFLIFNRVEFPRTHDIEQLVKLAEKNGIQLIDEIEELEYLTDFAVVGRYEIVGEDIEEIEDILKRVISLKDYFEEEVLKNETK